MASVTATAWLIGFVAGRDGSSEVIVSNAPDRGVHAHERDDDAGHGEGHDVFGPVDEVPLTAAEQEVFDAQWAAAAEAAVALQDIDAIRAAGYVPASSQNPGVGAHWINWSLVGEPFDPARPSMVLIGHSGDEQRLAGFSYWIGSEDEPAGFAGPNDHWHRHRGLCFVDGWLKREDVLSPAECEGEWVAGDDLWMLHAWVVPGSENRWGRFAPTNPDLCPRPHTVPDVLSCQPSR